jgi:uncharacterized protein YjbI with pentapeptide repeats
MKIINHEQRAKIDSYIKNGKDISELLEGYELKGGNFNNAIIKKITRYNEDLSNCTFVNTVIGELGTETNLSGCTFDGSNFKGAKFLGRTIIRNTSCKNCNFNETDLNHLDYSRADFRGSSFCEAIIQIGSMSGHGALFDKSILELLTRGWVIK